MTSGFVRGRQGRVQGEFAALEADLIRHLVSQVVELVSDDAPHAGRPGAGASEDPLAGLLDFDGPVDSPDDPVLARLLPDAYRDDDEAAGEFRRFTERSMRDQKAGNGRAVVSSLTGAGLPAVGEDVGDAVVELELGPADVQAWLRCLTDVRLALAIRLGVEEGDEDYWDALPDDSPQAYLRDVYDWLGFVQETLVAAAWRN